MVLKIKASKVFDDLNLNKHKKIICLEGGSRSTKTWSIILYFIVKSFSGEQFTLRACRDKLTWCKSTVLNDFKEIIDLYDIAVYPEINSKRPEQEYIINGCKFIFNGLDDVQKLHGAKQDYFWINEANETSYKNFEQLELRTTKQGILDYNPSFTEHWIIDRIERRDDAVFLKSTMLDNPFLPHTILKKILSLEPTRENIEQGTADETLWNIYGLGLRGVVTGIIFNNWSIVDDIPSSVESKSYGMDFGYVNDPSTLIQIAKSGNNIYVNELLYKTGQNNRDLIYNLRLNGLNEKDEIIADNAEMKTIDEIYAAGFNIKPCIKGNDSVNQGIDVLKRYKLLITKNSVNLLKELRNYKWIEDKNGKIINKPIDNFNHAIDALRYVVSYKYSIKKESKFVCT